MPRSAKGWPALRCARSPAPRGRCARRSWEAGDEGEGGRKKKKNQIRSRSVRAGRAARVGRCRRCPRRCPPRRRSGGRSRGACVRLFMFHSMRMRSSSSRNRAVSSRETSPPRPRARSSPLPRISCLREGGVVLCALRRQEGRERDPLGYAEDFFLLQNALKGAEVLAYIQLHTSVNLSLCSAPKPHASNPPKSHSRRSRGQEKATPGAGRLKKIVINPPSCREKANTTGTNQIASLPTGPVALSPP